MAITTESASTRQFVNVLGVQLTSIDTGLTEIIRTPNNFTIDFGFKTSKITGVNGLGQKCNLSTTTIEAMGMVEITVGKQDLRILALAMGRYVQKNTADNIILPFRRKALLASTPAIPAGGLGFDITADPVGLKGTAKLRDNLEVALVQQPYATFVPATPLSFAVGAAGAMKFSTDLLADRADIEMEVPYTVDTRSISEQSLGLMSLRALMRNSDDSVSMLHIPYLEIDPEGTKLDPGAENTTIKAPIFPLGGYCDGWKIFDLNRRLTC
jgi:hypothetical protein